MKHKSKNHTLRRNPNVRMKINLLRHVVFTPCLCYQLQLGILDTGRTTHNNYSVDRVRHYSLQS